MEMLYSPTSPAATSTDSIPSLNDPGASSEGDGCPNVSSALVDIDDDGSGVNEEPSKDSILTLLGMRFLPTTNSNTHIPSSLSSPITPMAGQTSSMTSTYAASPSTNHSLSSFLTPLPLTPASSSSSAGLPTSFSAMSPPSASSASAFPYYSTSLLSPSSSSPPAVYSPPSPTMSSSAVPAYQPQQGYQQHHLQYQPQASPSYQLSSQLLYPQHSQQLYQQQPQQYQIVPQQQSYVQQQYQQQQQQHSAFGQPTFSPSPSPLFIQAHLNADAGDHHSFAEPLGMGHGTKRKADMALAESGSQHHHHHHPTYQHGGELQVSHRRGHDGYGHHHHHGQYQHHHHHHHQQHQHQHQQQGHNVPQQHQQQLVVVAKAKKRRVRKTWTERFQQLKEFKHRFGHCKVPKGWSEDPKLARWVCNMRQSKRMGKMKEERVRKLEELGFLWRCEQTGKVIWEEMIDKLKIFQARYGHCRVPVEWPEDPQLSAWVVYVRQRNRANNLSQEKVKELDAIQFVWTDVPASNTTSSASNNPASGPQHQRTSDVYGEGEPGRTEERNMMC